jgi:CHASE3 domain sensor protein
MKKLFLTFLFVSVVISCVMIATIQADESKEESAQKAAESWLALVDAGKYSESWEEAAQLFKERVTKQHWEAALKSVRSPLGKLKSRRLKSA